MRRQLPRGRPVFLHTFPARIAAASSSLPTLTLA